MTRSRLSVFVFVFACSIFLEGCGRTVTRETMATVFQTEGEISIAADRRSSVFTQSQRDSCLHVGDRLKTSAAASIDFASVPGVLVRLSGNSELLIENLSVTKDGNLMVDAMKSRDVRIRLIRGVLSIVVGEAGRESQAMIATPTGVLLARPRSTYRLEVAEGKTRAICVRGRVELQTEESGQRVLIEAGYFQEWPATTSVPRLAAESDAQTQTEVATLLEVERNLLSLQKRERTKPLRRGSDDEGGIFRKIPENGSRQRLQLSPSDDRELSQRSLWSQCRFFGGSCVILFGRFEPGFTHRHDHPRGLGERCTER